MEECKIYYYYLFFTNVYTSRNIRWEHFLPSSLFYHLINIIHSFLCRTWLWFDGGGILFFFFSLVLSLVSLVCFLFFFFFFSFCLLKLIWLPFFLFLLRGQGCIQEASFHSLQCHIPKTTDGALSGSLLSQRNHHKSFLGPDFLGSLDVFGLKIIFHLSIHSTSVHDFNILFLFTQLFQPVVITFRLGRGLCTNIRII